MSKEGSRAMVASASELSFLSEGRASRPLVLDAALNRIAAQKVYSFETTLHKFKYLGDQRFEIGGEELDLSDSAWLQLCRLVHLPIDLLQRLRRHLGHIVFRSMANDDDPGGAQRFRVVHAAKKALALTPPELACLSNEAVVGAIRAAWPAGVSSETVSVTDFRLTETEFELSCHTDRLTAEPREGDILHGGITIRHSQAGLMPTVVLSYVYRLVCANGLTQRVCLGGKPARTKRCKAGNSAEQMLETLQNQVTQAFRQLDERLEGFKGLLEHRIEIDDLPEMLRRRWSINRRLAEEIALAMRNDELGRTYTEYDLVNGLSRVASHATNLLPRYRRHLALAAGMLAQRHVHHCPACGSWLDGPSRDIGIPLPLMADSGALSSVIPRTSSRQPSSRRPGDNSPTAV